MIDNKTSRIAVIVTAAGCSTRMGGEKKEFMPLGRGTILSEAVKQFFKTIPVDMLVITVQQNGEADSRNALFADAEVRSLIKKETALLFVTGGQTRQESVFNALTALAERDDAPDYVLIHDAARPFVTRQIISDTLYAAEEFGAAAPCLQPPDTQKEIDRHGFISAHLDRSKLVSVQTPQGFDFARLLQAHKKAVDEHFTCTDDTEIWGKYVGYVKTVDGTAENKKITYMADYPPTMNTGNALNLRTGIGYDIHKLVEGRTLVIGGVQIPYFKGEAAHSDGDVLLHAVIDALLGASGLGDIGTFFPSNDPKWKDADSMELLRIVWSQLRSEGWQLLNMDCIVKLEQPKLFAFRESIVRSIAGALGAEPFRIFVKAKTGEKIGAVGAGDAVEAWCNCLLVSGGRFFG